MTSPPWYSSTSQVDAGNSVNHLSEEDVITGNSVTSSRNFLSMVSHPINSSVSPGQNQIFLYLSSPEDDAPGLVNGRESVASPGECNNNYHRPNAHQLQQQQKVSSRTSRAVSVPASLHRDLEDKGEGHRQHFSSGVVKLSLQPTRE